MRPHEAPRSLGMGGCTRHSARAVLSPIAAASGQAPSAVLGRDALDPETAAVLDALPSRGGMGPNRIGHRAGLEPGTVLRCLGALAAAGFAERCEQGWRLRRS
jgi:DNA-binding MarR family transcriptional regulator